jgi:hypothetical protein
MRRFAVTIAVSFATSLAVTLLLLALLSASAQAQNPEVARYTVTTTASLIAESPGAARSALIRNTSTTTSVYLGQSGVTSTTGFELKAGESLALEMFRGSTLYAITASGTAEVHVMRAVVVRAARVVEEVWRYVCAA